MRLPSRLLLLLALALPIPSLAAPNHKLKPGASGKLCLECHGDFEAKLKLASVHTPVRAKDCTGCHNPHAAGHPKLLAAQGAQICGTCHRSVTPEKARSTHRPVAENKCGECHDPHATPFKNNLVKAPNDLCAGCHKPVVEAAAKARHKHRPVEQGCTTCHAPHGSAKAVALLKSEVPALCTNCHKTDKPSFAKQHMNYSVAKSRCTSCHDPHGSSSKGMLYDHVHQPVAKGQCTMCHEAPGSPNKFRPKQVGANLCRGCHSDKLNKMLGNARLHQPVAAGDCLACHSPHASKERGLVAGNMNVVCGRCHSDTIQRQQVSPTKHTPVRDGDCTNCHDPHSGNAPLLLTQANDLDLCKACHEWQKHTSHPVGLDKKDPRNPNLTLGCASCHRAHGTPYLHLMMYAKASETCTKCHEQFKR
jgi:DmsE family decaheme c-type cytochrome